MLLGILYLPSCSYQLGLWPWDIFRPQIPGVSIIVLLSPDIIYHLVTFPLSVCTGKTTYYLASWLCAPDVTSSWKQPASLVPLNKKASGQNFFLSDLICIASESMGDSAQDINRIKHARPFWESYGSKTKISTTPGCDDLILPCLSRPLLLPVEYSSGGVSLVESQVQIFSRHPLPFSGGKRGQPNKYLRPDIFPAPCHVSGRPVEKRWHVGVKAPSRGSGRVLIPF